MVCQCLVYRLYDGIERGCDATCVMDRCDGIDGRCVRESRIGLYNNTIQYTIPTRTTIRSPTPVYNSQALGSAEYRGLQKRGNCRHTAEIQRTARNAIPLCWAVREAITPRRSSQSPAEALRSNRAPRSRKFSNGTPQMERRVACACPGSLVKAPVERARIIQRSETNH